MNINVKIRNKGIIGWKMKLVYLQNVLYVCNLLD